MITVWAPGGFNERVAGIGKSYLPQPPVPEPPVLWADPAHVRACFQSTDVELTAIIAECDRWAKAVPDGIQIDIRRKAGSSCSRNCG